MNTQHGAHRALVVGGGLCGMTAALLLRRHGLAVDLLEIDPSWQIGDPEAAVSPEAVEALRALEMAVPPGQRRAELVRTLADMTLAQGVEVRLGCTLRGLRLDAEGIEADSSDGRASRYALLVGADGRDSRVRECLLRLPTLPPNLCQHVVLVGSAAAGATVCGSSAAGLQEILTERYSCFMSN